MTTQAASRKQQAAGSAAAARSLFLLLMLAHIINIAQQIITITDSYKRFHGTSSRSQDSHWIMLT